MNGKSHRPSQWQAHGLYNKKNIWYLLRCYAKLWSSLTYLVVSSIILELELMIYVRTNVPKPNINMDLLDSKIERRATNYIIISGEIVQISMDCPKFRFNIWTYNFICWKYITRGRGGFFLRRRLKIPPK